jgi:hypothetical protein
MAEPIVKKRVAAPVATVVPLSDFNALKISVEGQEKWIKNNQLTEEQQDATFAAYKAKIDAFDATAAGRLDSAEQKLSKFEPDINDLKRNIAGIQTNVSGIQTNVAGIQNSIVAVNTKLIDYDKSFQNTDDNFAALGMTVVVSNRSAPANTITTLREFDGCPYVTITMKGITLDIAIGGQADFNGTPVMFSSTRGVEIINMTLTAIVYTITGTPK